MHWPSLIVVLTALCSRVSGHGLIIDIQGANGVYMPGLTVVDGAPRDCSSSSCGSQDDTAIIRDDEFGTDEASALGRSDAEGPVDPARNIAMFLGGGGGGDDASNDTVKRGFLDNILGGGSSNSDDESDTDSSTDIGTSNDANLATSDETEGGVAASAGKDANSGLPTASGSAITMTHRQINQDGTGPLEAAIDPTSGGTDLSAFQPAEMTQDARLTRQHRPLPRHVH